MKTLTYESYLALQRRLVYDISGNPELATLVVCEHSPAISIGREGSRSHVRLSAAELVSREWRIHWAARGGGVQLHVPGQISIYPLLPVSAIGIAPADYTRWLLGAAKSVVQRYTNELATDDDNTGLRVRGRSLVRIGAAIRFGVSAFGLVLNACPDLELFDRIQCSGDPLPMTSLERESPYRIELPVIRRELAEAIREAFGYRQCAYFHSQPQSLLKTLNHANLANSRTS